MAPMTAMQTVAQWLTQQVYRTRTEHQTRSPQHSATPHRPGLGILAAAVLFAGASEASAATPCPWNVQLHKEEAVADQPLFDIVLMNVAEWASEFYGFTLTSPDVAQQLMATSGLPDLSAY